MTDETVRLTPKAARALISSALTGAGTAPANASYFTEAILDTELSGLEGHGFYWLQYYCEHLQSGKVDGKAKPTVKKLSPVAFQVEANKGFAHPAIEKGFEKLIPAARKNGIAAMAVHASYNSATLGFHTGYLAKQGLLAFGFTNSSPAIAPVGGKKPVIGTNPLSFAVPGKPGKIAFLIDQSSSATAWTSVKRAADEGRPIPLGLGAGQRRQTHHRCRERPCWFHGAVRRLQGFRPGPDRRSDVRGTDRLEPWAADGLLHGQRRQADRLRPVLHRH